MLRTPAAGVGNGRPEETRSGDPVSVELGNEVEVQGEVGGGGQVPTRCGARSTIHGPELKGDLEDRMRRLLLAYQPAGFPHGVAGTWLG